MRNELSDWQRVTLPMLLLSEMRIEPGHGYGLSARLAERGFERIVGAKLYPVLNRLESDGYCVATWAEGDGGPGRKIYSITAAGREHLRELSEAWERYTALVSQLQQQLR